MKLLIMKFSRSPVIFPLLGTNIFISNLFSHLRSIIHFKKHNKFKL